jgi:gas vesicle protein
MAEADFERIAGYEDEITALEEETEQKVSQTLSKIEEAIEAWKAAGYKPQQLQETIKQLQKFYEDLSVWEKRSLMAKRSQDIGNRIKRLSEFAELCARYEKEELGRAG